VFTTTKTKVHDENETRILSLVTDDSREQTARVLLELADETNGHNDLEPWRDFQRWLASGDAEHRVTIPYGKTLAKQVPPAAVRLRRDFGSLLALIRAHAVLHQVTRDRDDGGRIIATIGDYEQDDEGNSVATGDYAVVRELVADIIAESVDATVSRTVRETVAAVGALEPDFEKGVSARAVAEMLKLDRSNAGRRLRVAADGGYVRNLEDKRGKPARWVTHDPLPGTADLLPDPERLRTSAEDSSTPPDQECCGVAPGSEGYSGQETISCRYCGAELTTDESIRRGYCNECFLRGRR